MTIFDEYHNLKKLPYQMIRYGGSICFVFGISLMLGEDFGPNKELFAMFGESAMRHAVFALTTIPLCLFGWIYANDLFPPKSRN